MVGLAGFAFGLVASGIWLYILSPVQTATMILCFGFLVQSYAVWVPARLARLAADLADGAGLGGSAFPIGIAILTAANPVYLRMGVGAVLVLYSVYGLARPAMKPLTAGGVPADIGAGVVNGILGGTTGLAGVVRDDLVPVARRPARPAARGVPAGRRFEFPDVRAPGSAAAAKFRRTPGGWCCSACRRSRRDAGSAGSSMGGSTRRSSARPC